MAEEDPNSLARLLGVDPGLDADKLRAAYDQEMTRATRSGDHRRALELSRAFDALPGRTRSSVYSGGRTYASVVPREEPSPRPGRRTRGPRPGRPRSGRRISWKGVVGYGIVVPAIVVLVGWSIVRQNSGEDYTPPPDDPSPVVVETAPAVSLLIPADAPVAANGFAKVLCQTSGDDPGYVLVAAPGATVQCDNGAVPELVAP